MISFIARAAKTAAKGLATTEAYKYGKGRVFWYYKVLISPDFSRTMTNLYNYNKVERDLNDNAYDHVQKKVFHISPEGFVYDARTGDIIGNINEPTGNRYRNDAEYETNSYGNYCRKDNNDEQPATA